MSADIPFSEADAARKLGISKSTLIRARVAGLVHPMRLGPRTIRYTQEILEEFESKCRTALDKSETTGSVKGATQSSGVARGTTPPLDRRAASLLAQQTFKKAS